jgi:hypothetical protein
MRVIGIALLLGLVTSERHWQHHQQAAIGYGDIFSFLINQDGNGCDGCAGFDTK